MARTTKSAKKARARKVPMTKAAPGAQPGDKTVEELIRVLNASSVAEDIESLKRAGILTKDGKVAKLYLSWGNKVSRTPEIDASGELQG